MTEPAVRILAPHVFTATQHGPGAVIVPRGTDSRYLTFDLSLGNLYAPPGTVYIPAVDANPAKARNDAIRAALRNPYGVPMEWVALLDDDHEFDPFTLIQLLDRKLPVVSGMVASKRPPFVPVIFKERREDPVTHKLKFFPYKVAELDGVHGLWQIPPTGAVGAAWMVVRREVFDVVEEPWFRVGQYDPEELHEDIWFCDQLHRAGIPVYVDLEVRIGHLDAVSVGMHQGVDGRWVPRLSWSSGAIDMGRD